jgi:hypothetical protein
MNTWTNARKWDVGVNKQDSRVYVEYQGMDTSIHNEVDIRLYVDGNFGSVAHKLDYAEIIKNMLNEVTPDATL